MLTRRAIVVIVVFVVLAAGIGGAVLVRQQTLDQRATESRATGMEAAANEDWVTALSQIGRYLQRFGQDQDADALCAYAKARAKIPLPNNQHLQQAMSFFRRVLQLDPDNRSAQHELLLLYDAIGYGQETLTLAATILEQDAEDIPALRAEARAYTRLRDYEAALVKTARIAELDPSDITNHQLALLLMSQMGKSAKEILEYPSSQKELDPDGTAFQLTQSIAYELAASQSAVDQAIEYRSKAVDLAKGAAKSAPADPETVIIVNQVLERYGLYGDSLQMLERTARDSEDETIDRLLFRRLFEVGNLQSILERANEVSPADEETTVLAIRAMAHGRANQSAEVESAIAEFERRKGDPGAAAWAAVLRAVFVPDADRDPKDVIDIYKSAIEQDPENPYFYYFLGLAYEKIAENELAFEAWKTSNRYAPAWVEPVIRSAGLLASMGNYMEATSLAEQASKRAPGDLNVRASVAQIVGAGLTQLPSQGQRQLLDYVQQIQTDVPFEPRTLPILIELEFLLGNASDAVDKLNAALNSDQTLPEKTLLQLARISSKYEPGLTEACFDKIESLGSLTPAAAYAQAVAAHEAGDSKRGKLLLENAAKASGDNAPWLLPIAQYLELIGDEGAVTSWAAVADNEASNVALQRRVLESRAAWRDEALIDRVINRLRESTGEDAVGWRLARARWLLQTGTDASEMEKDAAEAVVLLNEVMTSSSFPQFSRYTLMAAALERLHNIEGAIDNLEQALRFSRDSNAVRFELARLLQVRGNNSEATRHLNEIIRDPQATNRDRRLVAAMLARMGDLDRAIDLLLQTYPPENRESPPDLLLAQFYRQNSMFAQAAAVCRRVMEETPSAAAIAFAADMFASNGQMAEAQSALKELDGLKLDPGMRELLLADFQRSHGTTDEGERWYRAAIAARPSNAAVWRRYLGFLIQTRQLDRAVDSLDEAAAACPDDAAFRELSQSSELLRTVASQGMAVPLILAAIESPGRLEQAIQALEIIRDEQGQGGSQFAIRLRQLSDTYPGFLELKMQLVRLYGSLGGHREAAALASAAMAQFPNAVEPAYLAAESYAALRDWGNALDAAKQWRSRSGISPKEADLQIAEAQIQLGRSSEALETIQPYIDESSQDPSAYSEVVVQRARAMIQEGRAGEAAELLAPRLENSDRWRMAWVRVAATDVPSVAESAAWLERVAPLIPNDAVDERQALAVAWLRLSDRGYGDASGTARTILEELVNRPDATATAAFLRAQLAERETDYAAAEKYYRMALQLQPEFSEARNNLAMCLITQGERLQEAVDLAKEAVQAASQQRNTNPRILASFHDTLAQSYAAIGDLDAAIETQKQAVDFSPTNPNLRERLAQYQATKDESARTAPGLTP